MTTSFSLHYVAIDQKSSVHLPDWTTDSFLIGICVCCLSAIPGIIAHVSSNLCQVTASHLEIGYQWMKLNLHLCRNTGTEWCGNSVVASFVKCARVVRAWLHVCAFLRVWMGMYMYIFMLYFLDTALDRCFAIVPFETTWSFGSFFICQSS